MTAPVDWTTLGLGDFGAIPKATVDYCDGPEVMSTAQPDRFLTRWAAWQASDGIRIARTDDVESPDGLVGSLSGLFDGETTTHLSMCFEQNSQPVIAIQKDATTIEIRRFVDDEINSFEFTGTDPLMFFNGILVFETGDTDAVCYYLDSTRTKVLMRAQRDNFGIEYTVAEGWSEPITKLQKVDRVVARAYIWGNHQGDDRKSSRQVVIRSQLYPAWPGRAFDEASLTTGLLDGAYVFAIVEGGDQAESAALAGGFLDGTYFDAAVSDSESEAASLTAGFEDGAYTDVVVDADGSEAASLTAGFEDGIYTIVIVLGATNSESALITAGFLDGTYA